MLTITIPLEDLDETIPDLYDASDRVMNPDADELDGEAQWYIDNGCIDADGNIKPITIMLISPANHYVGKLVVEDYEGAAAWIVYDSQGTRRGVVAKSQSADENLPAD